MVFLSTIKKKKKGYLGHANFFGTICPHKKKEAKLVLIFRFLHNIIKIKNVVC